MMHDRTPHRRDPLGFDIRWRLERRLAWYGTRSLSIGDVRVLDERTLLASLRREGCDVRSYEIDVETGSMRLSRARPAFAVAAE